MPNKSLLSDKPGYPSTGFALVLVLWVLSLMILMAGSFAKGMRREIVITDGMKSNAQALVLAESALAIAEYHIILAEQAANNVDGKQYEGDKWRMDGSLYQINYQHADNRNLRDYVRVRLFAETGKVDLNFADPKVLQALLKRAPISDDNKIDPLVRVSKLVGAITDWHDDDDILSHDGAEKNDYQSAGLPYRPPNRPFQTVEELQLVLGMDAKTYQWLEPHVTVYAGQDKPDKNLSAELLRLLPGLDNDAIQGFLRARFDTARTGKPLNFPLASEYINTADTGDVVISGAFTVVAEAKLADGSRAAISAVVTRQDVDPVSPFQVVKWQRNYTNETSLFDRKMGDLVVAEYNQPQFYE
jgi:general secretion pathway protein K